MNKLKLTLLFIMTVGSLIAQDLSKLTPDQMEMYKKYMAGKNVSASNTSSNSNTYTDNVVVRNVDSSDSLSANQYQSQSQDQNQYQNQNQNLDQDQDQYQYQDQDKNQYKDQYKTQTQYKNQNQYNVQNNLKKKPPKFSVFGSYLFAKQNLTFEPKLNIPTPVNYILGTYDELVIDISGFYEANYKLKVSPEGLIRIPNVGPIKVSGLTIENASRLIKNQVSKVYMGVSAGQTKVNVTLGNIRSIRVTVVGEAFRPGTYTLPSLATAFNALYACGGPNETGTMRDIKVIRAGKIIAKLDVYQFLVDGLLVDNIGLHDEDIIRIDSYKIRVTLDGAVKHNGIFEGLQGESLQNLLQYAGGYADNAYKERITAYRLTGKEKTVVDVTDNQIKDFMIKSGDSIVVSTTLNRFDNRIDINGSVFHPGVYALEPGLTVKQLILKAGGVKEDAYLNMAYIIRKRENRIPENFGFNLGEVLNGNAPDITLQKDDRIEIRSLFEFRQDQKVSIIGEVKAPGTFQFIENLTLKDLIFKARGFTDMASTDSVELVRVIRDQEILLSTDKKTIVKKFSLDKDLNFKNGSEDILLENEDQVIVRRISGYEGIRMVRVEGELLHPGSYNITNKAERISDIVRRAGGFTNYAYPRGAFLIRQEQTNDVERKLNLIMQENSRKQLESQSGKSLDATMLRVAGATTVQGYTAMDSIQKKMSGSSVVDKIFNSEGVVGLNLKEIISNPGGKYDLKLEEGDIIYVPRELQTVRVLGQVLFPAIVRYDNAMSLKDYISNSGGFSVNANRGKVFVLYANGTAKSTKSFLGFKTYPKIEPGARIVVPDRPVEIKNKLTPSESVAILTSISSVVALIYSILKQ